MRSSASCDGPVERSSRDKSSTNAFESMCGLFETVNDRSELSGAESVAARNSGRDDKVELAASEIWLLFSESARSEGGCGDGDSKLCTACCVSKVCRVRGKQQPRKTAY